MAVIFGRIDYYFQMVVNIWEDKLCYNKLSDNNESIKPFCNNLVNIFGKIVHKTANFIYEKRKNHKYKH